MITRRGFVGAASAAPFLNAQRRTDAPNVLFIISDQMRADALGLLGNPNAHTPNLDRLARGGMVFDRCYSNNPVCVPSRKSMFSGLYPHEHGSLTNQPHNYLGVERSMIDHFRRLGYRTGYCGKNHTFTPTAMDRVDFASVRDREKFRGYSPDVPPEWHAAIPGPEEKSHAYLNTEDALRFLNTGKPGDPWFLTVSYFEPHPPYFAPARHIGRKPASDIRIPARIGPESLSPRLAEHAQAMRFDRMSEQNLRGAMQHYHASIDWGVDEQVGRLMTALSERKLLENTVIVFTSDHGDFMGHYGMVRKGSSCTKRCFTCR